MGKSWKIASLALGFAFIGAASVFAFFRFSPESAASFAGIGREFRNGSETHFRSGSDSFLNVDKFFDDDFFRETDPFEEMRRFREEFNKRLPFNSLEPRRNGFWFNGQISGGGEISRSEDDHFVIYEVKLAGVDGESVKTNVEGGYLTITGEVKRSQSQESQGATGATFFSSSFRRSFPLPEDVDPSKMEMQSKQDKLILKFPKLKHAA